MSKRVMLSGYYGFENFGDDLILYVMVELLKSFGVEPLVLSGNPEQTEQLFGVESIQRVEINRIWKAMREVDAFMSGGGGLFQDTTGLASPIYYGGLIEIAHWCKRPVAFFAQGIGPIQTTLGRFMTARALKHSDLIVVRDLKSQAWVSQIARQRAELMADPVWLWQPGDVLQKSQKQGLAISIRPWHQLHDYHLDLLAKCIANLPNIHEQGVNLIDCQAGTDIIPLAKLEQSLKNQRIPCRWFSGSNCAQGIAQSTAILGMRYHALLAAAHLAIPAIALSYDPKVQLLASQLGLEDCPVSTLETLTTESIQNGFRLANKQVIEDFRNSALNGFSLLKAWLEQ